MDKLKDARGVIDSIDREMAKLFEQRMKAVEKVVCYKIENNLPVFDASRENVVVEKNLRYINEDGYKEYYRQYIQSMMDISKQYQEYIIKKTTG